MGATHFPVLRGNDFSNYPPYSVACPACSFPGSVGRGRAGREATPQASQSPPHRMAGARSACSLQISAQSCSPWTEGGATQTPADHHHLQGKPHKRAHPNASMEGGEQPAQSWFSLTPSPLAPKRPEPHWTGEQLLARPKPVLAGLPIFPHSLGVLVERTKAE